MTDDVPPNSENGRVSTASLLRDLGSASRQQGEAIAGLLAEIKNLTSQLHQMQTRWDGALARLEITDQALTAMRAQHESMRATFSEFQGETRAALKDHHDWSETMRERWHDDRNFLTGLKTSVQMLERRPPPFSEAEQKRIRQGLDFMDRYQVGDEGLEPREIATLKAVAAAYNDRKKNEDKDRTTIRAQIVTIPGTIIAFSLISPLIAHLLTHWFG